MTLNMMLNSYVYEEDVNDSMSVRHFRDDDNPLKVTEKPVCIANIARQVEIIQTFEATDPTYIKWQIFDEINATSLKYKI